MTSRNTFIRQDLSTPLFWFAGEGNYEAVQVLVAAGADTMVKTAVSCVRVLTVLLGIWVCGLPCIAGWPHASARVGDAGL